MSRSTPIDRNCGLKGAALDSAGKDAIAINVRDINLDFSKSRIFVNNIQVVVQPRSCFKLSRTARRFLLFLFLPSPPPPPYVMIHYTERHK